jgi:hypothetical protein
MAAMVSTSKTGSISARMDEHELSKYLSEIGRKGGYARAKRLTAEQRKEIATKASKAAAKARSARKAAQTRQRKPK